MHSCDYHLQDIKILSIITIVIVSIILIITITTLVILSTRSTTNLANDDNIFIASGTGENTVFILGLQLDVPFSEALYKQGSSVSHNENESQFNILESGEYEIYYQLATYNPIAPKTEPIDMTVKLISNKLGTLDTIQFDTMYKVYKSKIITNLQAGDTLKIECSQPELTELYINSQTIVIKKI